MGPAGREALLAKPDGRAAPGARASRARGRSATPLPRRTPPGDATTWALVPAPVGRQRPATSTPSLVAKKSEPSPRGRAHPAEPLLPRQPGRVRPSVPRSPPHGTAPCVDRCRPDSAQPPKPFEARRPRSDPRPHSVTSTSPRPGSLSCSCSCPCFSSPCCSRSRCSSLSEVLPWWPPPPPDPVGQECDPDYPNDLVEGG